MGRVLHLGEKRLVSLVAHKIFLAFVALARAILIERGEDTMR